MDLSLDEHTRLIDVSSEYCMTWFDDETPAATAVSKAIQAKAGFGEIVRTLLGHHHVAVINTGTKIGVISLTSETPAVRQRLSQLVEKVLQLG